MNKPKKITKPFVLMVEGKDDAAMLYSLLPSIGIDKNDFQVWTYESKDKFNSALKLFPKIDGFEQLSKLAIIMDADLSSDDAFKKVRNQLLANENIVDEAVPTSQCTVQRAEHLSIGIFIAPDCQSPGALETLLLSSLKDEMHSLVKSYITDSESHLESTKEKEKYKKSEKSETYAYSALFENANFHDTFVKELWDWDHPTFDRLKTFVKEF